MRTLLIPASCGLLLGMSLSAARLISPDGLRDTLRFRPSHALKATLWALGTAIAAMALLCWLAVMDIDRIVPLPLHAGTLAGGMLFGVCAALCGFTPGTALTGMRRGSRCVRCVRRWGVWRARGLCSMCQQKRFADSGRRLRGDSFA